MFDTFNGLPVHPLVVHGVVVLLPLAILGTILIAIRPRWRKPYGLLVVAAALAATVMIPVATSSGESLEERVGGVGEHAELGDQLLFFAIALVVSSLALVWLQRRADRQSDGNAEHTSNTVLTTTAVVAVVAAVACGVQVYRVGDSGARAAWGDTPNAASNR